MARAGWLDVIFPFSYFSLAADPSRAGGPLSEIRI